MKILLVIGVLIVVLAMWMTTVTESYKDSTIDVDIDNFNTIKSAASSDTKTLALRNLKLNLANHTLLLQLINKYGKSRASVNKKVTYDLTVDQAIQKLQYRKDNNKN